MKEKISISVDKELLNIIDKNIKEYKFANRSHAVEYCIAKILKREK
ncbi:MAG TPA: ribbon-helix-helix domain-containing protein [Candidatus Nanoarchaeia archaeon]|nr:ribbon-helix-helix domain-containing protein [Candidatus Nanoarchaeia archaeon]